MHSFNSPACESQFRDTRSLSGAFSTKINFTVKDFLQFPQKLAILNQPKYNQSDRKISCFVHHKHAHEQLLSSSYQADEIDTLDIEQTVSDAFNQAVVFVEHSKMYYKSNEYNINNSHDLSECIYDVLNRNSRMIYYSFPASDSSTNEFELDEDSDDKFDMKSTQNSHIDELISD